MIQHLALTAGKALGGGEWRVWGGGGGERGWERVTDDTRPGVGREGGGGGGEREKGREWEEKIVMVEDGKMIKETMQRKRECDGEYSKTNKYEKKKEERDR